MGIDLISYNDIPSIIKDMPLSEQIKVLREMFSITDISAHQEGVHENILGQEVTIEKLEGVFYVQDTSGKTGIFIENEGLLDFGDMNYFVDKVTIDKHNLEISNQMDKESFHEPFTYVYVRDEGKHFAFHYIAKLHMLEIVDNDGNRTFNNHMSLASAIAIYKATLHIESQTDQVLH